jgi:sodium-dependent phosphate transporter
MDPALPQYLWIVIMGVLAALGFALGTGMNDLANSMASSIGSKTLTLKQAVIIASIFEFLGAILLSRVSTNVIAGGIANITTFQNDPAAYAYGMLCSLAVCAIWQMGCSYYELNVSSTHSIIASILGFSFVWGGANAVNWYTWNPSLIPPFGGVVPIILSWFISPILTGIASAFIMFLIRHLILRRKNSVVLAIVSLPVIVFITAWINVFFILTKGAAKILESTGSWSISKSVWVSAAASGGLSILTAGVVCPILYHRVKNYDDQTVSRSPSLGSDSSNSEMNTTINVPNEDLSKWVKCKIMMKKIKSTLLHGVNVDIHQVIKDDKVIGDIHDHAEKFDKKTEYVFSWLQVFSAICVSLVHGAGDVGYLTGPLATIYNVYLTGTLTKTITPEVWIIILCALGLVVGLATFGYRVSRAMGTKLAMLSPSRGFSVELATALVLLVASQFGLPTSSSQAITGSIVGVGLLEGARKGVNWKLFAKQFVSWVATMVVCALGTAGLFAQGVYSPSKLES